MKYSIKSSLNEQYLTIDSCVIQLVIFGFVGATVVVRRKLITIDIVLLSHAFQ